MKKVITLIFTFLFLANNFLFAQDDLPQEGVLISTLQDSDEIPDTWGGVSLDGGGSAPIVATLEKKEDTLYDLVVSNTSGNKYKANIEVTFFDKNKKRTSRQIYPFILPANSKRSVSVRTTQFASDYLVKLVSWKNLSSFIINDIDNNNNNLRKKRKKKKIDNDNFLTDEERFYK